MSITLDGSDRRITLTPNDLKSIRLAYAQHVYRQQGATVERAIVLTGGWQTTKETAYVEATRAQRTDWHIAHQDLNPHTPNPDPITRLAQRMSHSRAHTPTTIWREQPAHAWDDAYGPGYPDPFSPGPWPAVAPERDDLGRGR